MTSPEWEAANEDDSDRFPQTSHASSPESTESHERGSRVVPDPARVARYAEAIHSCVIANPEQMRDLTEAVVAVADEERAALVAEVERLRETSEHRAELLRDALRERDGKQDALVKLFASWRRVRDLANERLARAEAAEAKVAKVEALRGHGSPVVLGGVWGTWVADSEWDAVLADAPTEQRAEACADCGHLHTPDGCTGPPTPSDVWAGVSPAGCDCDAAEGDGRG